ncbi:PEP-CTERM sorting domain-containing protein [Sphingomonas sp. AP4-R1]|uniref:PEPxxWA-CTERM sorting domain-containing protein n=1 Tax=Sphingomonas sp. AP4-R1 TaxID=2735134 RepID=UPI00149336E0|nr:PEPxxWA-CTERM sorting domain-containing protein [Sphingomonas sp. AP4-R1]QJU59318.1 PEP-CTERM sorting domain-containing protein [Sphingomonas sp. AP4-R1]
MRLGLIGIFAAPVAALAATPSHATYWNVFNVEGERTTSTALATYDTATDMFTDTNRTGTYATTGGGQFSLNIVDSGSDGSTYWNLFNVEGERTTQTAFATYASLADMATDTNRTGTYATTGGGQFSLNIVGSGTDGTTYWNLFNVEGERTTSTALATYATAVDMFTDANRTGTYATTGGGQFSLNIVDSGSDGSIYWNLFNVEGERTTQTAFATYASLADMATDSNRTGTYAATGGGQFSLNIVGSGSDSFPSVTLPSAVPEPATWIMMALGFGIIGRSARRGRAKMLAE